MYVWQDYVAGTDPTDPKSQFMAKRIYTTYGKKTLEGSRGGEPRTAARF